MLDFKNIIEQDIREAFFCDDLFSETHYWNGQPVNCIVDNNEIMKRYDAYLQAYPVGLLFVLVPVGEFREIPGIADAIMFDNGYYHIRDIKDEDGVLAILLAASGML